MSSLAGALDQPVRHNYGYGSLYSAATQDQDVDMEPPNDEPEVKEGHTSKEDLGTHRIDGGDAGMEDLFGNDAEVEEAKDDDAEVKSDMYGSLLQKSVVTAHAKTCLVLLLRHLLNQGTTRMNFHKGRKNAEELWNTQNLTNLALWWSRFRKLTFRFLIFQSQEALMGT